MQNEPKRAPLGEQAAHQEDTTESEAGTAPVVHRRTILTVERETVSILIRRPVRNEPSGSEPAGS